MLPRPQPRLAARGANRRRSGRRASTRRQSRSRKTGSTLHGGSFLLGVTAGAALVLFAAYAPELLQDTPLAVHSNAPKAAEEPLEFEFHDLLGSSEVVADTAPYEADLPAADRPPDSYLIQAAAFKHPDDAETLRANLLLQDLPVAMSRVALRDGHWYRVTVGPFESRTHANRAMTQLREQELNAIWIKKQT